jgi:hypothetical protein
LPRVFVTVRNRQAEKAAQLYEAARPPVQPTRASYVAMAKLAVRRKEGWSGWMNTHLLSKHTLSSCGCGLIHCR